MAKTNNTTDAASGTDTGATKKQSRSGTRTPKQQQQQQQMMGSGALAGGGVQLQPADLAIVSNAWGTINAVFSRYGLTPTA